MARPWQSLAVFLIPNLHLMNTMKIEIYSDLICPWCYIGKRRMQAGLELLGKKFGA
jgi:predicted DsbA family dithiol-disulfide isomerase